MAPIKKGVWVNTFKIGTLIFFTLIAFSVLFSSGKALFSGDWETVVNNSFKVPYIGVTMFIRILVAYGYAFFISYKNLK
ncbi:MAG: hypothetical protein ACPGR7_03555 [Flavobacteriaceae bacterium]